MTPLPLRWRVIIALIALVLGTSLAFSYLTEYFLNQGILFRTNVEMAQALNDALTLAKENYDARKRRMNEAGNRLFGSPTLQAAFETGNPKPIQTELKAHRLQDLELQFLTPGKNPAEWSAMPTLETSAVFKHPDKANLLCLAVPILQGGTPSGILVATARIDQLLNVENAVHTFKHLEIEESEGLQQDVLLGFLVTTVCIVILACLIGIRMGFGITRPLYALIKGTREMARDNLDYRIPPGRDDEIGLLIESFNRMAEDLKENRRKRLEAEQIAAWREIARRLAHEIKNPLTPIQLTVQQMRDKYDGADPGYQKLVQDCTEIVTEEVENLRALVQEFANFARMPSLSLAPHDLNAVILDVVRLYPDTRIELDLASTLPDLHLDPEQMRRVLINLIENGIEASGSNGRMVLTTHTQPDTVLLTVADSGPGIPFEEQERIFQPYVSTKESGMGLGLAVVKGIVEEHEGHISATNPESGGARFEIHLPVPEESFQSPEVQP